MESLRGVNIFPLFTRLSIARSTSSEVSAPHPTSNFKLRSTGLCWRKWQSTGKNGLRAPVDQCTSLPQKTVIRGWQIRMSKEGFPYLRTARRRQWAHHAEKQSWSLQSTDQYRVWTILYRQRTICKPYLTGTGGPAGPTGAPAPAMMGDHSTQT